MQEQFKELMNTIREILDMETDEEFANSGKALIAQFRSYFSSFSVDEILNDILVDGDEKGYTLDQHLNEFDEILSLFHVEIDKLAADYTKQPNKQNFLKEFIEVIDAFVLACAQAVINRESYNVSIQLCHPDAKMPTYAHENDRGADVYAVEDQVIEPFTFGNMVRTGIRAAIPHGWAIAIRPRSGVSHTTPLRISNSPATIDEDYRGEIKVLFDNFTNKPVTIEKGQRIAQFVLEKNHKAKYRVIDDIDTNTNRGEGGFGSSGV